MRTLVAASLTLAVLAVTGVDAGAKQTYCQKTIAALEGKVSWHKHGVTLYRTHSGSSRIWGACSDAKRSARTVYVDSSSNKAKPKLIRVAGKRCVAIEFKARKKLPELAMKDLVEKNALFYTFPLGNGNPSAAVGSLAVSSNCAVAWGESDTDGSGLTSHHIRALGFSKATSLSGNVTEVATVNTPADTKHVGIKAAHKRVKVKWTESGVVKRVTLP